VRKGEQTRQEIIRRAAPIFNQRGYDGAALSDLMRATGLEKGGIYRHFGSKQELAGDAFDYAWKLAMDTRFEGTGRFRIRLTASNKLRGTFETGAPGWFQEAARC
jgi:AcrR family transcriptional regulator